MPERRWRQPPTVLVIAPYARSVPIATTGCTPAKRISSGVISEPPPIPVSPIRTPDAEAEADDERVDHATCSPHSVLSVPAQRPRARCPAACTARSRSRRSPGRGAGGRAGRARRCASRRRPRSSPPAGCTSRSSAWCPTRRSSAPARVAACSRRMPVIHASAPRQRALERRDLRVAAAVLRPGPRTARVLDLDVDAEALLERPPGLQRLGEEHAGVDRHDARVRRRDAAARRGSPTPPSGRSRGRRAARAARRARACRVRPRTRPRPAARRRGPCAPSR